jgi:hypothetical protein
VVVAVPAVVPAEVVRVGVMRAGVVFVGTVVVLVGTVAVLVTGVLVTGVLVAAVLDVVALFAGVPALVVASPAVLAAVLGFAEGLAATVGRAGFVTGTGA